MALQTIPGSRSLKLYNMLARGPFPSSYVGKFLLVAFLGVHVPLIVLLGYVAWGSTWGSAVPILLVALVATLVGSALTLMVQNALLAPVLASSRALDAYVNDRALPSLPREYSDEAGLLMRNTQECITHLAALVALKNDLLAGLWICRTFTELQGGTICLTPSEAAGARFEVRFPAPAKAVA